MCKEPVRPSRCKSDLDAQSDVDEFIWFNKTAGIRSLHQAVHQLIKSQATPVQSLAIPRLRFGSSGLTTYSDDLVIDRFNKRYNHENCLPLRNQRRILGNKDPSLSFCETKPLSSWEHYKSMSFVPEIAQVCFESVQGTKRPAICNGPHRHTLKTSDNATLEQQSFKRSPTQKLMKGDTRYLRDFGHSIAIMHYGTKSREEFYSRVCSVSWKNKYFRCPGCTPETVFDAQEIYANNYEDNRMIPFARQLKTVLKDRQSGDGICKEKLISHSDKYYQDCWSPARKKMEQKQKRKQTQVGLNNI